MRYVWGLGNTVTTFVWYFSLLGSVLLWRRWIVMEALHVEPRISWFCLKCSICLPQYINQWPVKVIYNIELHKYNIWNDWIDFISSHLKFINLENTVK